VRSKIRLSGMVDIYLEELLSSPYLVVVVVVDVAVDPEASIIMKREPRGMYVCRVCRCEVDTFSPDRCRQCQCRCDFSSRYKSHTVAVALPVE